MKTPQNENQVKFFEYLIGNGGNVASAAEAVGYSRQYAYHLAKEYSEYLLERVQAIMCLESVRAANTVVNTMSDDGSTPNAKLRLEAALQILDRAGITKQDRIKLDVEGGGGVFLLPAKEIKQDADS